MAVELNTYLFFPGNAEQAVTFYQGIFGGKLSITRRGDVDPTATPEQQDLVVNAELSGGDVKFRASDREDTTGDSQNRIELTLVGTDEARLRELFDSLADGGTVPFPLERQFWGDIFGTLVDRFGITWQVNIGPAAPYQG